MANTVLWPLLAGTLALIAGLAALRGLLREAKGWERLVVCGPAVMASALAAFGAEHFTSAREIATIVPKWMPWQLFWVYFFGVALLAAAAWGLALMFFLFVGTISLPGLVAHPGNRIIWMLTLRDSSFGAGCLAFAGWLRGRTWTVCARYFFAVVAAVYGVMHFLHAGNAPGVPLEKMTPAWVPAPHLWAYLVGLVLVAGAVCLLSGWLGRMGAAAIGLAMIVVTVALYVPIFVMAASAMKLDGLNYIFDTLLYAGAALLVAAATPYCGRSRTTA